MPLPLVSVSLSMEQCLDFIDTDELLEVTPHTLRIRKKILDPVGCHEAGNRTEGHFMTLFHKFSRNS